MLPRRAVLLGLPAAALLGALPRPAHAALEQREYRGRLRYFAGARENGRERFVVTVQPGGLRTLRAQCEIDEDRLLRDVVLTVDADWRPLAAFVQLTIAGRLTGATGYRFTAEEASAEGWNATEGRISQRYALDAPADAFGTHPIHGDAWNLARLRRAGGRPIATPRFTSSALSNGASGPGLVRLPAGHLVFALEGRETVTVPAGTFAAERFTMRVPSKDRRLDVWAFGEDCVPARMVTSDGRRYELVQLEGEFR